MADNSPPSKKLKASSDVGSSKSSSFLDNVAAGRTKVNKNRDNFDRYINLHNKYV